MIAATVGVAFAVSRAGETSHVAATGSGSSTGLDDVTVEVATDGVAPLIISAGPVKQGLGSALQHEVLYTNTSDQDVFVTDTRSARIVSGAGGAVMVGDEGCFYVTIPTESAVEPYCNTNFHAFVVPARSTHSTIVTIWLNLPGFSSGAGEYTFVHDLEFSLDPAAVGRHAGDPLLERGVLRLTYRLRR